jgi:hypothetical protein
MKNPFRLSYPGLSLLLLLVLSACSPISDIRRSFSSPSSNESPPKLNGDAPNDPASGGSDEGEGETEENEENEQNENFAPYETVEFPAPSELAITNPGELTQGTVPGAEFRTDVTPRNVRAEGSAAIFDPSYLSESGSTDRDPAWAMYFLDMDGQEAGAGFDLTWSEAPALSDLWVGIAHWGEDRWIWRQLDSVDEVLVDSNVPFIRSADQVMACLILTAGVTEKTLDEIVTADVSESETPPGELANVGAFLGTNLARITDYGATAVFIDAFRNARLWTPQAYPYNGVWNSGEELHVGPDGNITHLDPGTSAAAIVLTSQVGIHPAGDYTLLYEGTGKIEVRGEGSVIEETPGRKVVRLTPGNSLTVIVVCETDPFDPIRNIRLILPGFESVADTQVFHPDFLSSLEPFNVIRFMDWAVTNETEIETWADRALTSQATYTSKAGVPLEVMVELCNEVGADLWYCIPHAADEDYVRRSAELIRDTLDPTLRLHLEYSNEVWNWGFPQTRWASQVGIAKGYASNVAHLRIYSERVIEFMDIASEVFESHPERLVRVIAAQSGNPWVGAQVADWPTSDPAYNHVDVLAVAPYFGGSFGTNAQVANTLSLTVQELVDACEADSISRHADLTRSNAATATARGLELVAYEGGQHLVGVSGNENNAELTALFVAANRHPQMRDIYLNDLRRWDDEGGKLFMAFTHVYKPSKWGAWGMLESLYQDRNTAYKWLGVMDWIAENSE